MKLRELSVGRSIDDIEAADEDGGVRMPIFIAKSMSGPIAGIGSNPLPCEESIGIIGGGCICIGSVGSGSLLKTRIMKGSVGRYPFWSKEAILMNEDMSSSLSMQDGSIDMDSSSTV